MQEWEDALYSIQPYLFTGHFDSGTSSEEIHSKTQSSLVLAPLQGEEVCGPEYAIYCNPKFSDLNSVNTQNSASTGEV